MGHRFPSAEWTDAFATAINENDEYRTHGKEWTHGAVAMVVKKDPSIAIEDDTGMILDVHRGECRKATFGTGMSFVKGTPFVIVAPYARWKDVIEGRLDPIKGMMEGKLELVEGHLPTIIRFVQSNRALVKSAAAVPTDFPA